MNSMFHRRRGCGCMTFIFLLCLAVVIILGVDSNLRIVTQEYSIESEEIPEAFGGFRIVLLSDIHDTLYNGRLYEDTVAARPDIIAVTGDLIDGDGQIPDVLPLMKSFNKIAPTYFVTGNHEWATSEALTLLRQLREAGIHVLENDYEVIEKDDGAITLVGFGDPNGHADQPTPEEVMDGVPEEARKNYIIALYHRNQQDGLEVLIDLGADLILCGHSHGGLIRLPGTDGLWDHGFLPTLTSGLYEINEKTVLVSRGIGNSRMIRFMNNPHIAVAIL